MSNLYPKTHIDIFVVILSWDGERAALCNAITASSLAIADAGIECVDLTVGMSCGISALKECVHFALSTTTNRKTMDTNEYQIDLTKEEEKGCTDWTVLGYMAARDEITYLESNGHQGIEVTLEAARAIRRAVNRYLETRQ
ncbi:Exosome complex component mtr3 [Neolecta irregularis DAH-3]|uniref:Exosome complex component mtr3 n=1 Tax=Neolecta irregularis (strain DAH-3) TaxID=1198029 RepID=A0A1U7LG79_NEOID|nr:Exosome complex component mtr3 [Neolecta irregularis DAH-3]|eukprot:OLL21660.1 Exosome complex component mtr3 [Neolecta irregularis DAH-3]